MVSLKNKYGNPLSSQHRSKYCFRLYLRMHLQSLLAIFCLLMGSYPQETATETTPPEEDPSNFGDQDVTKVCYSLLNLEINIFQAALSPIVIIFRVYKPLSFLCFKCLNHYRLKKLCYTRTHCVFSKTVMLKTNSGFIFE